MFGLVTVMEGLSGETVFELQPESQGPAMRDLRGGLPGRRKITCKDS